MEVRAPYLWERGVPFLVLTSKPLPEYRARHRTGELTHKVVWS